MKFCFIHSNPERVKPEVAEKLLGRINKAKPGEVIPLTIEEWDSLPFIQFYDADELMVYSGQRLPTQIEKAAYCSK